MLTKKDFIERCTQNYPELIDYTETIYRKLSEDITYTCNKHGKITQSALDHKHNGCRQCKEGVASKLMVKDWVYRGSISKAFDGFKFYIVKLTNTNEIFYKYGITFGTLKKRFQGMSKQYSYEVIVCIQSTDAHYIMQKERQFQSRVKSRKYKPKFPFDGQGECFRIDNT